MLKTIAVQLINSIVFPVKPLAIGESFSQSTPLSIPVQGVTVVKMIIHTKYTLREVSEEYANFDIIQDYALASDMNNSKTSITGNGKGTMVFDRVENQIISTETQSQIVMTMMSGPLLILSNFDTISETSTTINDTP
jgi:CRISPR/Cas system CMR subunit Cmr4 (Cas7 group RAMP superfamily)